VKMESPAQSEESARAQFIGIAQKRIFVLRAAITATRIAPRLPNNLPSISLIMRRSLCFMPTEPCEVSILSYKALRHYAIG
jgi:hypothetical protein